MVRRAFIHRFTTASPDDVSPLEIAINRGDVDANSLIAVLGKTEGNGCVNDFTRAFAVRSLEAMLTRHISADAIRRVAMVMSGGTEGGLSPCLIVFEAREVSEQASADGALALGRARTAELPSEHLGRREQIALVADGVRAAMSDAGLVNPAHVHYVQVKCPLLTTDRVEAAEARGNSAVTRDTLKSMSMSRAASALGVAVALGELQLNAISDQQIGRDTTLACSRAATSAGVELLDHEIMVAGMSTQWGGPLIIDHAVMSDAIDIEPVRETLVRLGLSSAGQLGAQQRTRIKAVLAKAEASQSGSIRENRHTMLNDSDISSTRHARALVGGVLAGVLGFTDLFVSGGAEHQGPDGGGPVAIIASR